MSDIQRTEKERKEEQWRLSTFMLLIKPYRTVNLKIKKSRFGVRARS